MQSSVRINVDPDAVRGLKGHAVDAARSAEAAVRSAVKSLPLVVTKHDDGSIDVSNDILVVARQDEAEQGLLARATTSSSRTGQTLREQPRNTAVISSKLLAQQQAVTIVDALRNAGGVSVNTGTVQGGNTYSVRGFSTGGIVNGMPSTSSLGGIAGGTQPIANVERVEVLKGPDALLSGADNLGGTVNIVTKKPYAGELLTLAGETGSFGQARLTLDANNQLNDSGTLSARLIAVAATATRNFGGYRGNEDYLFAPSIRFKDARTDIVLDVSASNQIYGANPYTAVNPATNKPFDRPRDQPILSSEQGIQIGNTRLHGEASRTIGDWLTLVVRGQHEAQRIRIGNYAPFAISDGDGTTLVSASNSEQRGTADAVDGFVRIKGKTGWFSHTLVIGATHVWSNTDSYSASQSSTMPMNILTDRITTPLPPIDTLDYNLKGTQFGLYGQYVLGFWKFKLLAGVRRNTSTFTTQAPGAAAIKDEASATSPNYGVVLDMTRNLSAYVSASFGYAPTFSLDFEGSRLPNIRSRNREAGVKLDLFNGNALLNASYFELLQSNLLVPDPAHPSFNRAVPGQEGKGIDLSVTGRILPGWSIQAGLTRTNYSYLTPSDYGDVVVGQPRYQYNLYTSYDRKLFEQVSAGLGAGLFGRSGAAADSFGEYVVPPSRQVDVNAFLSMGPIDLNLGVRNLFNRDNYGITYARSYLPYSEPRNWRLTATVRLW